MTEKYVGTNKWKYRYFKSPIGITVCIYQAELH